MHFPKSTRSKLQTKASSDEIPWAIGQHHYLVVVFSIVSGGVIPAILDNPLVAQIFKETLGFVGVVINVATGVVKFPIGVGFENTSSWIQDMNERLDVEGWMGLCCISVRGIRAVCGRSF